MPAAYPIKASILCDAASVLLCHNHPSGDFQPSQGDRSLTQRLVEYGKLLGISVIDHITLGDSSIFLY
jgi:DNA repair protein RadC